MDVFAAKSTTTPIEFSSFTSEKPPQRINQVREFKLSKTQQRPLSSSFCILQLLW
jgi:hypothetical protein